MSTVKIIKYQDSGAFTYDPNKAIIDLNGARLTEKVLGANDLLLATGRLTQEADLGASLPIYPVGTAVWSEAKGYDTDATGNGNYFSLNDDSGRDGLTPLTPTSHFDFGTVGAIRCKITVPYTGMPSSTSHLISTGDTLASAGLGSLISIQHLTDGRLYIRSYNALGTLSTNSPLGIWSPVAGQAYELEFNYNGTGATLDGMPAYIGSIFIDGIMIGSAAVRSGTIARDYFYLGTYYNPVAFSSEASFQDVEIFNKIQHSANFASEIPRIVGIYPEEALIVPIETSLAEGFISLSETVDLPNDTLVKYLLRVESNNYWIDGLGDLVVSDGTLLESTSAAEWSLPASVALVDAFIVAGARITLLPILSSGSLGLTTPDLDANTLTYNFFAVPIACIECTLYGWVKDNCHGIIDGTVRVYTKKPILTQGNLVAIDQTVALTAPNGFFEMDIVRPNLVTAATSISSSTASATTDLLKLEANWVDEDGKAWSIKKNILIPDEASVILTKAITDAEAL